MILFGAIVFSSILKPLHDLSFKSIYTTRRVSINIDRSQFSLAYTIAELKSFPDSRINLAKKNFLRQNLWQKVADAIWSQAVFLSVPTKAFNKYAIELNYLDINKDQESTKKLLAGFSRSLLDGSICSSLNNVKHVSYLPTVIKYNWLKFIRLKQQNLISALQSIESKNYFSQVKSYLTKNPFMNRLPLFIVSNNLGQIIISEPPSELKQKRDVFNKVMLYKEVPSFYQAWFFISFNDAQDYMRSIDRIYGLDKDCLRISACSLLTVYNFMEKFSQEVYFKIVPDLQEVSSLIKSYRYRSNISFHERQKYSAAYFQGQPLYILKNAEVFLKHYKYANNNTSKHHLVFTSYEAANDILGKMTNRLIGLKVAKRPELVAYNLESFIKDHCALANNEASQFLLVPSQSSYWYTKKYLLEKKISLVRIAITGHISSAQLWSKRILWSLTSKHP